MAIAAKKQPEKFIHECVRAPEFRCESCGQAIESLNDIIIEQEYGFEGEAWGTMYRQEPHNIAITKCCRSPIIDACGETLDAYILEEEL